MIQGVYLNETLNVEDTPENSVKIEKLIKLATIKNPEYQQRIRFNKSLWKKEKNKWIKIKEELPIYSYGSKTYYEGEDFTYRFPAGLRNYVKEYGEYLNLTPDKPIELITNQQEEVREFQEEAVKTALKEEHGIIVAPTGGGKTRIALKIVSALKQKTLIIVHNKLLLNQWITNIKERFNGFKAGIVGSGKKIIKDITVATINSISKITPEIKDEFNIIFIDECHRVGGKTYIDTLNNLNANYKYGLTATPERSDGANKLLTMMLGKIIYEETPTGTQEKNITLAPKVIVIPTQFNWEDEAIKAYMNMTEKERKLIKQPVFNHAQMINAMLNNEERNNLIIEQINKSDANPGKELITVVSTVKEHLRILFDKLPKNKRIVILTADESPKVRATITELITKKEVDILLSTIQLIGEGYDCQHMYEMHMASPTKFSKVTEQAVGRFLRNQEGKRTPVIYDYLDYKIRNMIYKYKHRVKTYSKLNATVKCNLYI